MCGFPKSGQIPSSSENGIRGGVKDTRESQILSKIALGGFPPPTPWGQTLPLLKLRQSEFVSLPFCDLPADKGRQAWPEGGYIQPTIQNLATFPMLANMPLWPCRRNHRGRKNKLVKV